VLDGSSRMTVARRHARFQLDPNSLQNKFPTM
jgi:hypothetical protein